MKNHEPEKEGIHTKKKRKFSLGLTKLLLSTFHRILDDNEFNGTLDMGDSISQQLQIVNFKNNHLTGVKLTANYNKTLM